MSHFAKRNAGRWGICALVALFILIVAMPAAAQKNKDKKKDAAKSDSSADNTSLLPDSQLIDRTISEALGYWQIGDVESLHRFYSDDVLVISGDWEPPMVGWNNYAKTYQAQRPRLTGVRLDRMNTFIKATGNSAWATYQWKYAGSIDGKPFDSRGHTTLVLNKLGDHWVIVLDHSSTAAESAPEGSAISSAPAQSGRP